MRLNSVQHHVRFSLHYCCLLILLTAKSISARSLKKFNHPPTLYSTPLSSAAPLSWRCPEIEQQPAVECSCDMPHTLRCNGVQSEAMQIIGRKLRSLPPPASVSLLDCTVQNVSALPGPLFEGVALHGLVVSSGQIKDVHKHAFVGLASPLQALGLPNNQLSTVPTAALAALPTLDRLDLSHNLLTKLDNSSFKGLENLTFLDLSDNKIATITEDAFIVLPQLRTLRLRGNGLTVQTIATLKPSASLADLDLSSNSLFGPLARFTVPAMPSLQILQLSSNMLSSMKKGALQGFSSLKSLMLHHNQIDVLEDHSFENLSNLTELDLSHNRIVAVSGASLEHLENLLQLDLSHNFLRAVTADLILPLRRLKSLNLDDNDISIIASDAFHSGVHLQKLHLAENPLNCDCSLIEFAIWLKNATSLAAEFKNTVQCMTPPSLENALLIEIPIGTLNCGEDEHEPLMAPPQNSLIDDIPVANVRVSLRNLIYTEYDSNNKTLQLEWMVDEDAIPYTCDTLFIYEDQGYNEVLTETHKFQCNSWNLSNPQQLLVTISDNLTVNYNDKYRFCIVLFDESSQSDDISLIVGCSDIVTLKNSIKLDNNRLIRTHSEITDIDIDFTIGNIIVNVKVIGSKMCLLNIELFENGNLLLDQHVNCSESHYIFNGLNKGPYEICASILSDDEMDFVEHRPFCVPAQLWSTEETIRSSFNSTTNIILVVICITLSLTLLVLVWGVKRILTKPKLQTHQYFLPPSLDDEEQHSRYVKLQATTKL